MVHCFSLAKIKNAPPRKFSWEFFPGFSEQLSTTSERMLRRTKTVTTSFPDNIRTSHQEVSFEIAGPKHLRKVPRNHPL